MFLIASLQLLTVLGIKTQNDLFQEEVSAEETTTSHGESIIIKNILARVLPSRITVSDAENNIMIIEYTLAG